MKKYASYWTNLHSEKTFVKQLFVFRHFIVVVKEKKLLSP